MSYALFSALPYGDGDERLMDTTAIQNWKLHGDAGAFLREHIASYAPSLLPVS